MNMNTENKNLVHNSVSVMTTSRIKAVAEPTSRMSCRGSSANSALPSK